MISSLHVWNNNKIITGGTKDNTIGFHDYLYNDKTSHLSSSLSSFKEEEILTKRLSSFSEGHKDYISGLFCQWNRLFTCSLDGTLKKWSLFY